MSAHTEQEQLKRIATSTSFSSETGTALRGSADDAIHRALHPIDTSLRRDEYVQQGSFLYLSDFLPADATQWLIDAAKALLPEVNRNYLPGHKAGGSVSRHTIDELAPYIAELYRSPQLIAWLEKITGDRLLLERGNEFETADVTGAPWIEIDFPNHVKRAAETVLPQLCPLVSRATQTTD